MAMARRRRTAGLWAFAGMAAAHALLIAWLATQASVLKFRAAAVPDLAAVRISLLSLPSAAAHARPVLQPTPAPEPLPAPEVAASGPATIDEGPGDAGTSNLARPVFLDWPHPTPPGVDWGGGKSEAQPQKLAASGPWAGCQKVHDKDQDDWRPGQVKPPCLSR
jgi:hypothetical protein